MCGRFARNSTQEVLADWFGVELEDMPCFAPSFNVAPQSVQPVVRLGRDSGNREFALMRWSLVPFWAKDAKLACCKRDWLDQQ
jgi:putative SOS response-associated peptidase YedK